MTHIENISHVLQHGITHSSSPNSNPAFVPIGDGSLIKTRSSFQLDNGKLLGEYIPFYFARRTPMLFVIQKGYNMVSPTPYENIVYCVTSIQKIIDQGHDFIFTDGHAIDSFTTQYTKDKVESVDTLLDKNAINAKYWKDENDLDLRRKKEAEFLVLGDIEPQVILGYLVYNQSAKDRLLQFGAKDVDIHIKPEYYF